MGSINGHDANTRFESPRDTAPPVPPPTPATPTSATTSLKRDHHQLASDTVSELAKRIKFDHNADIDDHDEHRTPDAQIVMPSRRTKVAPALSISTSKMGRVTADDFMAECAANGLDMNITPTSIVWSAPLFDTRSQRYTASELNRRTPGTACGSAMTDIVTPASNMPTADAPPFPVDGIATLQQAAAQMLRLLVKKDTPNREREMQVALGTIRTCLDVDFVPLLEDWRAGLLQKPIIGSYALGQEARAPSHGQQTPLPYLSMKAIPTSPRRRAVTPPSPEAPTNLYTSRETLRNQLAGALSTVDKLQKDLKRREEDYRRAKDDVSRLRGERDEVHSKWKEDREKLSAKLATAEAGSLPAAVSANKTSPHDVLTAQANIKIQTYLKRISGLEATSKAQATRIQNQCDQVKGLEGSNARLKAQLQEIGVTPTTARRGPNSRNGAAKESPVTIRVPQQVPATGSLLGSATKQGSTSIRPKAGTGQLPPMPNWTQVWEAHGKARSPRVQASTIIGSEASQSSSESSILSSKPTHSLDYGGAYAHCSRNEDEQRLGPSASPVTGHGKGEGEGGSGKMQVDRMYPEQ